MIVQIYSGGSNNKLYITLPILFSWLVVGVALAIFGAFYRNKSAKKAYLLAEERGKDLMEQGRRVTEELEEVGNTATKVNMTYFPMPFQHKIYDEKAPLALRRQGAI